MYFHPTNKRTSVLMASLLSLGLFLSACGDATNTAAPAATSGGAATTAAAAAGGAATGGDVKGKKLIVLWATKQEAVWAFQEDAIKKAAAADGVVVTFKDAGNSAATQATDVDNAISQKPDAVIFVAVDTSAASALIKKLKDAKIPVVAEDRLPDASAVDIYVTADSHQVGLEQAKFLSQKIGDKGNIAILQGEAGNGVAKAITDGNKEELKNHPNIKVIVDQAHDKWSRDAAQSTVENAINKNGKDGIQGILANNSGMAMGAVTAAKKASVDFTKTCIIGSDADKDAVESIIAGELCADVDKKPNSLGEGGYIAAKALMLGQKPASDSTVKSGSFDVPVKFTPVQLINKANITDMKYRYPDIKFPA
jgi:ABC-type sugar transport system substrate-binding protein